MSTPAENLHYAEQHKTQYGQESELCQDYIRLRKKLDAITGILRWNSLLVTTDEHLHGSDAVEILLEIVREVQK